MGPKYQLGPLTCESGPHGSCAYATSELVQLMHTRRLVQVAFSCFLPLIRIQHLNLWQSRLETQRYAAILVLKMARVNLSVTFTLVFDCEHCQTLY